MTPLELITSARRTYNAVGDTFWSDEELYNLIYEAETELSDKMALEGTFQTDTVVGQREYDFPLKALIIKRVEYDGSKLTPIDFRQDDTITLNSTDTSEVSTPRYYTLWKRDLLLRPIPDEIKVLKVYAYILPQVPTAISQLSTDEIWHPQIKNYLLREMFTKEKEVQFYDRYNLRWGQSLLRATQFAAKKKRGDSFAYVKDEDETNTSYIGTI